MIYNFLHYYKPYKRILYGVVIGSLVAALLDLIFPMMVRQILNEVLPQKNINRLLQDSGVLFILYLGKQLWVIIYCQLLWTLDECKNRERYAERFI